MQKYPGRVKLGEFIRLPQTHTVEGSSAGSPAPSIFLSVDVHPWFQREQALLMWRDLYSFQLLIWRTLDQGNYSRVTCPPGAPGLRYSFFFSSLYRNDKWSGGLKFRIWAHELSDLSNFLYAWNDLTTNNKISSFLWQIIIEHIWGAYVIPHFGSLFWMLFY